MPRTMGSHRGHRIGTMPARSVLLDTEPGFQGHSLLTAEKYSWGLGPGPLPVAFAQRPWVGEEALASAQLAGENGDPGTGSVGPSLPAPLSEVPSIMWGFRENGTRAELSGI